MKATDTGRFLFRLKGVFLICEEDAKVKKAPLNTSSKHDRRIQAAL